MGTGRKRWGWIPISDGDPHLRFKPSGVPPGAAALRALRGLRRRAVAPAVAEARRACAGPGPASAQAPAPASSQAPAPAPRQACAGPGPAHPTHCRDQASGNQAYHPPANPTTPHPLPPRLPRRLRIGIGDLLGWFCHAYFFRLFL